MTAIIPDILDDIDVDIDIRRCPTDQIDRLLDLVLLDRFLDYISAVILRRSPDRDGRKHYHTLVKRGLSRPAIVNRLFQSGEYRTASWEADELSPKKFVRRVYQDILGRWPDEKEIETYLQMASQRNGRRSVIKQLCSSSEGLDRGLGHYGRIKTLRAYARKGVGRRLPFLGPWVDRRHHRRLQFERLILSQRLLAEQLRRLRREMEIASLGDGEPFGFVAQASQTTQEMAIFRNALMRNRHQA